MTNTVPLFKDNIKPGSYNISNEDYHQGSGVSRSALMALKRSPYHYWYKHMNPDYVKDTDSSAIILGNALHSLILEPDKFNEQFFILPKFDKRTKVGAESWKQIQSEIRNKTILTESQHEELKAMEKSFHSNEIAPRLIENAQIEPSLYWNDSDTGILCKSRPDILRSNLVCDLKTAHDGSPWSFSKAVLDYGYHIQAAMIREALKAIKEIDIQSFWFIVIEKSAPYVVSTYKLDAAALKKGHEEFKHLLARYQYCLQENDWPAYEAQEISLPKYAFN